MRARSLRHYLLVFGHIGGVLADLSKLAEKRLLKERMLLEKDRTELEDCGIFVAWGDSLNKATAMILGPVDTPYAHAFFFFDVLFPYAYPTKPPEVKFRTSDGRVRFNPNLYVDGKVCLSILGTWDGPSWEASQSLRTVLFSIQSLLSEHPIRNEPGHEDETGPKDMLYSQILRYESIAVAVVGMLRETPVGFTHFRSCMRRTFLDNVENYTKTLEAYKPKDGSSATSPIYDFKVLYRIDALLSDLQEEKQKLESEADDQTPVGVQLTVASGNFQPELLLVLASAMAGPMFIIIVNVAVQAYLRRCGCLRRPLATKAREDNAIYAILGA